MPNTTYEIAMSRRLNRPTSIAYKVVEDIERFPEFMPNVNSLILLEAEGNRKVAAWDITIDDAPLSWIEESIYDKQNLIVHFKSLEGVFDRFGEARLRSSWSTRSACQRSKILLGQSCASEWLKTLKVCWRLSRSGSRRWNEY
ncbi:MAG: hypothetical protein E6J04_11645 [Chloroflexi bacterium]|nr:MAG: hypothetical protein E6J04_11645 [Chloroflexota bacterium]